MVHGRTMPADRAIESHDLAFTARLSIRAAPIAVLAREPPAERSAAPGADDVNAPALPRPGGPGWRR
jgi:hypothetical protein